ncbi:hypothetical protein PENTCL1PPCAC_25586 [Pristionchus entomophagus]|uniref:Uncharacterized protein n=1 Tax=Pristionchus entomophagus TaxID=358040 RepID=A0AAV5U9F0_9BILA|nr:hypothetical protein PENTCL1PPCAC_25586 [Pristionchus entomophagus]
MEACCLGIGNSGTNSSHIPHLRCRFNPLECSDHPRVSHEWQDYRLQNIFHSRQMDSDNSISARNSSHTHSSSSLYQKNKEDIGSEKRREIPKVADRRETK